MLDLARVLAGPWCTMTLADLGAEVWKVENPRGGDDTRGWQPPAAGGESAYYLCANRNKKSIAVDLATAEGQDIVRRLAEQADVLVENFRAGALDRYGLGYEQLARLCPKLVYCSISGYGRQSSLRDRPGYDFIIQAEGGLMAITGEVDGAPMKVGVAIADLVSGMNATQAILAALFARQGTGRGQHIDIALLDGQIAMLANVASAALVSGENPKRYGNAHQAIVPYQMFPTADREIAIAIGNDRQFAQLCTEVLEEDSLAADPRFRTNPDRVRNRLELIRLVSGRLRTKPAAEWLRRLEKSSLPAGAVRHVDEALAAPEVRERNMIAEVDHPTAGRVKLVASPLKLSETPVAAPVHPPLLGEHTSDVLREVLGLSDSDIRKLSEAGAIAVAKS